jgi:hypothetical protein
MVTYSSFSTKHQARNSIMRRVNIRGVAAVFMPEEYFKVVEREAKKNGFKGPDDFFTYSYYVAPTTSISGYVFALYAVESLLDGYLNSALVKAKLIPSTLLQHVNVGSEYIIGEPD